jgi:hypothetical protein
MNPVFAGSASGVLSTLQQLGTAIGVALIGVIYFGQPGALANTSGLKSNSFEWGNSMGLEWRGELCCLTGWNKSTNV